MCNNKQTRIITSFDANIRKEMRKNKIAQRDITKIAFQQYRDRLKTEFS